MKPIISPMSCGKFLSQINVEPEEIMSTTHPMLALICPSEASEA